MAQGKPRKSPGAGRSPRLIIFLTSHVWRQDHNGFSHQDPGFIDHVVNKKADIIRVYLPPDANTLLFISRQVPSLAQLHQRYRSGEATCATVAGYGRRNQALYRRYRHLGLGEQRPGWRAGCGARLCRRCTDPGNPGSGRPAARSCSGAEDKGDKCSGPDDATAERGAPAWAVGRDFDTLFTTCKPIIFAYHGYPWLIHRLTYRRTNHENLHVRGYKEEGTTTTPFDMTVLNDLDRFHLVMDVVDRVPALGSKGPISSN